MKSLTTSDALSESQSDAIERYPAMVLMVDDQVIVGEAVRRIVADQLDIDFHYCNDGRLAVRQAELIKPTVILQDLVMPGIDGLDLVRAYLGHQTLRDVPIVMLSTREDAAIKRDCFKAGASDYLVKLPDPIELIARIRHHSRSYLNQLQRDDAYRALRESQRRLTEINLELQRLSTMDGLTGLSNRRHFDSYLEAEWLRVIREGSSISLAMIDIDNFKAYNDGYGHVAGDEILRNVSAAMQSQMRRATDVLARYGGEEFALILPSTPAEGAQLQARRMRECVEALDLKHKGSGHGVVTISVGVATCRPRRDELASALIEAADRALYAAKQSGRNTVSSTELG